MWPLNMPVFYEVENENQSTRNEMNSKRKTSFSLAFLLPKSHSAAQIHQRLVNALSKEALGESTIRDGKNASRTEIKVLKANE